MNYIEITRYPIKNEHLIPWVKFIWHMEAADAKLHLKLLPTACIDVIINIAGGMIYETGAKQITAPPIHINGLRSTHSYIRQEKMVPVFGISFYPFGLFPFVRKSMTRLQNEVVDLCDFALSLATKLRGAAAGKTADKIIFDIESALITEFTADENVLADLECIASFLAGNNAISVSDFCCEQAVNIKTFERSCLRYTGFTPKALRNLTRFQSASNQLVHEQGSSLSTAAYDNCFTDQAHFTKEFKRFSGAPPSVFLTEKSSVKELAKYRYR